MGHCFIRSCEGADPCYRAHAGAIEFKNEWYRAAYYDPATSSYFIYPTAPNNEPNCEAPGQNPNTANCNHAVGMVTQVGGYFESPSPYGTYDQGGNV